MGCINKISPKDCFFPRYIHLDPCSICDARMGGGLVSAHCWLSNLWKFYPNHDRLRALYWHFVLGLTLITFNQSLCCHLSQDPLDFLSLCWPVFASCDGLSNFADRLGSLMKCTIYPFLIFLKIYYIDWIL